MQTLPLVQLQSLLRSSFIVRCLLRLTPLADRLCPQVSASKKIAKRLDECEDDRTALHARIEKILSVLANKHLDSEGE